MGTTIEAIVDPTAEFERRLSSFISNWNSFECIEETWTGRYNMSTSARDLDSTFFREKIEVC